LHRLRFITEFVFNSVVVRGLVTIIPTRSFVVVVFEKDPSDDDEGEEEDEVDEEVEEDDSSPVQMVRLLSRNFVARVVDIDDA